jgi:dTDP-4-amino-4,6-dideoxygalactose transaminase
MAVIKDTVPLPETERAVTEILTIPCFPELTDPEVDAVIAAVRSFRA